MPSEQIIKFTLFCRKIFCDGVHAVFFPCKIRVIYNLRSFVAKPVLSRLTHFYYLETNLAQHFVCGEQMTNILYALVSQGVL